MSGRGWRVGIVVGIVVAGTAPVWAVEDAGQTLPTLLIKGEIVSMDTNDPAAPLIKVKDRYGFETPIYLPADAKMTNEAGPITVAALIPGVPVEVEYNFDVNTAKRHAVSVKLTEAAPPAPASAQAPAASPAPGPAGAPTASPASPATAPPSAATGPPAAMPAAEPPAAASEPAAPPATEPWALEPPDANEAEPELNE